MRIRVCINNYPIRWFDCPREAVEYVCRQFYVSPTEKEEATQRLIELGNTNLTYGWNAASLEFMHEPSN
jgi:hypothetical protein